MYTDTVPLPTAVVLGSTGSGPAHPPCCAAHVRKNRCRLRCCRCPSPPSRFTGEMSSSVMIRSTLVTPMPGMARSRSDTRRVPSALPGSRVAPRSTSIGLLWRLATTAFTAARARRAATAACSPAARSTTGSPVARWLVCSDIDPSQATEMIVLPWLFPFGCALFGVNGHGCLLSYSAVTLSLASQHRRLVGVSSNRVRDSVRSRRENRARLAHNDAVNERTVGGTSIRYDSALVSKAGSKHRQGGVRGVGRGVDSGGGQIDGGTNDDADGSVGRAVGGCCADTGCRGNRPVIRGGVPSRDPGHDRSGHR